MEVNTELRPLFAYRHEIIIILIIVLFLIILFKYLYYKTLKQCNCNSLRFCSFKETIVDAERKGHLPLHFFRNLKFFSTVTANPAENMQKKPAQTELHRRGKASECGVLCAIFSRNFGK